MQDLLNIKDLNKNISIGILANENSRRLRCNKAFLKYKGKTFIETICNEFDCFSEIYISSAIKGSYDALGYNVVYDQHNNIGPIEGIYQILSSIKTNYAFVCAVDMPFINKNVVYYLSQFISKDYDCYCFRDKDRIHPICSIYSKSIVELTKKLIDEKKYCLLDILDNSRTKYIDFELSNFDNKYIRNINTKKDYQKILFPVIFCVSARKSNFGKTTLIEKLIKQFNAKGYSVGVIKHDAHNYTMDYEGKDTFRFSEAGAKIVAINSDSKYSINSSYKTNVDYLIKYCSKESDIVIIEGMRDSNYPKIEVIRKEVCKEPYCDLSSLICIASDKNIDVELPCPVYNWNDDLGIANYIEKYFGINILE